MVVLFCLGAALRAIPQTCAECPWSCRRGYRPLGLGAVESRKKPKRLGGRRRRRATRPAFLARKGTAAGDLRFICPHRGESPGHQIHMDFPGQRNRRRAKSDMDFSGKYREFGHSSRQIRKGSVESGDSIFCPTLVTCQPQPAHAQSPVPRGARANAPQLPGANRRAPAMVGRALE